MSATAAVSSAAASKYAGRVALVTGANKSIGFATAQRLAELGFKVLLSARDEQRGTAAVHELKSKGLDVNLLLVELINAASVQHAFDEVKEKYKRLDVLVNNAAMMDFANKMHPLDIDRMREEFEINFFAAVRVTDTFLPLMLKTSSEPRLVFVSTPLASHETVDRPHNKYANPSFTAYKCSKAAFNMYAHNLAIWLSKHSDEAGGSAAAAKVNCAYPGYVKTDMSFNTEEAPLMPYEGAETSVRLATLPADGPTGGFYHLDTLLPW